VRHPHRRHTTARTPGWWFQSLTNMKINIEIIIPLIMFIGIEIQKQNERNHQANHCSIRINAQHPRRCIDP